MAANTYDVGDVARISATFTSTAGAFADPAKVTFEVEDPSGNITTRTSTMASVLHPSTGKYTSDFTIDEAGVWEYRVFTTGSVVTAGEYWWRVLPKRVST